MLSFVSYRCRVDPYSMQTIMTSRFFAYVTEKRKQVPVRVLPFFIEMLKAEASAVGEKSAGSLLEAWILKYAKSQEAQQVLREYGKQNEIIRAVREAEKQTSAVFGKQTKKIAG